MIVKTKDGWVVFDKDKKRISEPLKTKKAAMAVQDLGPKKKVPEGGTYGGRGN